MDGHENIGTVRKILFLWEWVEYINLKYHSLFNIVQMTET